MLLSAVSFSWLTYLYFPIGFDLWVRFGRRRFFHAMIVLVTVLRLFMMLLAVQPFFRRGIQDRDMARS
jgi:hypothetical protein